MKFKKGLFYKHINCKDIIILVLWAGEFSGYSKLKIAYYNISPYPLKPWPINITDKVKIKIEDYDKWGVYRPCSSFEHIYLT